MQKLPSSPSSVSPKRARPAAYIPPQSASPLTITISPVMASLVGSDCFIKEHSPSVNDLADSLTHILRGMQRSCALAHDCKHSFLYDIGIDLAEYCAVEFEYSRGSSYAMVKNLPTPPFTFQEWLQRVTEASGSAVLAEFLAKVVCQDHGGIGLHISVMEVPRHILAQCLPGCSTVPIKDSTVVTPLVAEDGNISFIYTRRYDISIEWYDSEDRNNYVDLVKDAATFSVQVNVSEQYKLCYMSNWRITLQNQKLIEQFKQGLNENNAFFSPRWSKRDKNRVTLFTKVLQHCVDDFWSLANATILQQKWRDEVDKTKAAFWMFLQLVCSNIDIRSFCKLVRGFIGNRNYDGDYYKVVTEICINRLTQSLQARASLEEVNAELRSLITVMEQVITSKKNPVIEEIGQDGGGFVVVRPAADDGDIYLLLHAILATRHEFYDQFIDGKSRLNYICSSERESDGMPTLSVILMEVNPQKGQLFDATQLCRETRVQYPGGYKLFLQEIAAEPDALPRIGKNMRKNLPLLVKHGQELYVYSMNHTGNIVANLCTDNIGTSCYRTLEFSKEIGSIKECYPAAVDVEIYRNLARYHRYVGDIFDELKVIELLQHDEFLLKILFPIFLAPWHAGEVLVRKTIVSGKSNFTITIYAHSPFGRGIIDEKSYDAILEALIKKISQIYPDAAVHAEERVASPFVLSALEDLDYLGAAPVVTKMLLDRVEGNGTEMARYGYGALNLARQQYASISQEILHSVEFGQDLKLVHGKLLATIAYYRHVGLISTVDNFDPRLHQSSSPRREDTVVVVHDAIDIELPAAAVLYGEIFDRRIFFREMQIHGDGTNCGFLALGLESREAVTKSLITKLMVPEVAAALAREIIEILRLNDVTAIARIFRESKLREQVSHLFEQYNEHEQTFGKLIAAMRREVVKLDPTVFAVVNMVSHQQFMQWLQDRCADKRYDEPYRLLNDFYQKSVVVSYKALFDFCQQPGICAAFVAIFREREWLTFIPHNDNNAPTGLVDAMVLAGILPGVRIWRKQEHSNRLLMQHSCVGEGVSYPVVIDILHTHNDSHFNKLLLVDAPIHDLVEPPVVEQVSVVEHAAVADPEPPIFTMLRAQDTSAVLQYLSTNEQDWLRWRENATGNTLLHVLVVLNRLDLLGYVLEAEPGLRLQINNAGQTPYELALSLGDRHGALTILECKFSFIPTPRISTTINIKQVIGDLFSSFAETSDEKLAYRLQEILFSSNSPHIDLSDMELDSKRLKIILHAISQLPIFSLNLRNCKIDDIGAGYIADFLAKNRTLISLNLYKNNISDIGVSLLAHAISINQRLRELNLGYNFISDLGVKILCTHLITSCITELDLYGNKKITSDCYGTVRDFACQHISLTTLHFPYVGKSEEFVTDLRTILLDNRTRVRNLFAAVRERDFAKIFDIYRNGISCGRLSKLEREDKFKLGLGPKEDEIRKGRINVHCTDEHGNNALHIAVQSKAGVAIILWLLLHGVDCCARNNLGETAQMLVAGAEDQPVASLLKLHLQMPMQNRSIPDILSLSCCVAKDQIAKVLLSCGLDPNEIGDRGIAALHLAAILSDFRLFLALHLSGANLGVKAADGLTPLHYVIQQCHSTIDKEGRLAILRCILDLAGGVELCYSDKSIGRAEHLFSTPMELAVIEGDIAALQLMREYKVDLNRKGIGGLPLLHLAIRAEQYAVFAALLQLGVDFKQLDNDGNNILHLILQLPEKSAAKFLDIIFASIPHLAVEQLVNHVNNQGDTPWHLCPNTDERILAMIFPSIQEASGNNFFHIVIIKNCYAAISRLYLAKQLAPLGGETAWFMQLNADGNTPFMLAMECQAHKALQEILQHMQDDILDTVSIVNNKHANMLHRAISKKFTVGCSTLLSVLSQRKRLDIMRDLLAQSNSDVDAPLFFAVKENDIETFKYFLSEVYPVELLVGVQNAVQCNILHIMSQTQCWDGIMCLLTELTKILKDEQDDVARVSAMQHAIVTLKTAVNTDNESAQSLFIRAIKIALEHDDNLDFYENIFALFVKLPETDIGEQHLLRIIMQQDFIQGMQWYIKYCKEEALAFVRNYRNIEALISSQSPELQGIVRQLQSRERQLPGFLSWFASGRSTESQPASVAPSSSLDSVPAPAPSGGNG